MNTYKNTHTNTYTNTYLFTQIEIKFFRYHIKMTYTLYIILKKNQKESQERF